MARETNPNGVLIQFTPDTLQALDEFAKQNAFPGEKPNRSATLRALIRAEVTRRKKSKKVSQGA